MDKSSRIKVRRKSKPQKQDKPEPDFPLTRHTRTNRWCKKLTIRREVDGRIERQSKFYYFGSLDDWQGAKARYQHDWPYILRGQTPPPMPQGDEPDPRSIGGICNRYLTWQTGKVKSRELSQYALRDCKVTTDILVKAFGRDCIADELREDDWARLRSELASTRNPLSLADVIRRITSVMRFGVKNRLCLQPYFGTMFDKPSQTAIDADQQDREQQSGKLMFTPKELKRIIKEASVSLKAMILLSLNGGMGNRDVAMLPISAVDFRRGWVDFPRRKTRVPRSFPLWKETIAALRAAMKERPEPENPNDAHLFFITRQGQCWVTHSSTTKGAWKDSIGLAFGKLLRKLELKRPGLNYYTLRRCFETAALAKHRDGLAIMHVMGHKPATNDMSARYNKEAPDEARLRAVVEGVHEWLYGK